MVRAQEEEKQRERERQSACALGGGRSPDNVLEPSGSASERERGCTTKQVLREHNQARGSDDGFLSVFSFLPAFYSCIHTHTLSLNVGHFAVAEIAYRHVHSTFFRLVALSSRESLMSSSSRASAASGLSESLKEIDKMALIELSMKELSFCLLLPAECLLFIRQFSS